MKQALLLIITSLSLFACKNESRNLAEELCDCLKDAGFNSELNTNNMLTGLKNDLPCFKEFQEHFYNELKPLDNKERAKFMKDFSKALLNTYCGEIAFDLLPYDEFIKQMDRNAGKNNSSGARSFDFDYSGGISVCDCIKMYDEMTSEYRATNDEEAMHRVEEKYKKRIDECTRLSEGKTTEELKQMEEEAKNCR